MQTNAERVSPLSGPSFEEDIASSETEATEPSVQARKRGRPGDFALMAWSLVSHSAETVHRKSRALLSRVVW